MTVYTFLKICRFLRFLLSSCLPASRSAPRCCSPATKLIGVDRPRTACSTSSLLPMLVCQRITRDWCHTLHFSPCREFHSAVGGHRRCAMEKQRGLYLARIRTRLASRPVVPHGGRVEYSGCVESCRADDSRKTRDPPPLKLNPLPSKSLLQPPQSASESKNDLQATGPGACATAQATSRESAPPERNNPNRTMKTALSKELGKFQVTCQVMFAVEASSLRFASLVAVFKS